MSWGAHLGGGEAFYTPPMVEPSIVRIPISGPGRFNTAAVVRHRWNVVERNQVADGELRRWTVRALTTLRLPAFSRELDVSDQVAHSTSAWLCAIQAGPEVDAAPFSADDGAEFLWAVDRVHPELEVVGEDSRVVVRFDVANLAYQVLSNAYIEASSWFMYIDPNFVSPSPVMAAVLEASKFKRRPHNAKFGKSGSGGNVIDLRSGHVEVAGEG